jgi:hypothetical protein
MEGKLISSNLSKETSKTAELTKQISFVLFFDHHHSFTNRLIKALGIY